MNGLVPPQTYSEALPGHYTAREHQVTGGVLSLLTHDTWTIAIATADTTQHAPAPSRPLTFSSAAVAQGAAHKDGRPLEYHSQLMKQAHTLRRKRFLILEHAGLPRPLVGDAVAGAKATATKTLTDLKTRL